MNRCGDREADGSAGTIVLGSRSPRRRELLELIVPPPRIVVRPPRCHLEPSLQGANTWPEIERRLRDIVRQKRDDVLSQVGGETAAALITADTVIVAETGEGLIPLEQPPEENWQNVVREWFRRYLLVRPHTAATALCVQVPGGLCAERLVTTRVRFAPSAERWLEWYLATGEPRGKAGGYALQGAGSLFVEEIIGSPSNVVGLPLREVRELLEELHVVLC